MSINTNLAYNMRPQTIDQIVGQQQLVGPGKIVRRMVDAKALSSMILYGPPGIGKTSIASALSGSTGIPFEYFNASVDSKTKLQSFAKKIEKSQQQLIILLDEIHRLDKPKQDFLLPYMESGDMIIIGATTENPYITVNPAVRSRSHIFELTPIDPDDIQRLIERALIDKENGLGDYAIKLDDDAKYFLTHATNGDARSALNALEIAAKSTPENPSDKTIHIDLSIIEECTQRKAIEGDKNGDGHYNVISALQKSIRGSDVNAALHYLARILETGDLPIALRRLTVIAFEDIGLANPQLWQQVMAAMTAANQVGLPEAKMPLSAAVVLMALSPKSDSAHVALSKAEADLHADYNIAIPKHLRDTHYKGAAKLGNGIGYRYPHDFPYHIVQQQYLPDDLINKQYFDLPLDVSDYNNEIEKSLKTVLANYQKNEFFTHLNSELDKNR